jgi:hypothetical protein
MSKAQGQFTIIDYNDAITLTGFINSNQPKTQMVNPDNDSYTPDWSTSNLILTPSLYVIGTTTDKITSTEVTGVQWFDGSGTTAITTAGSYALSGTKNHILTVNDNVLAGLPGKDFRCEVTYKDPTTNLSLVHKMSISLSRVINGGGITDLIVTTPDGNVFKNSEVTSLTSKAELWRGSTVDSTSVTYKWAIMDASITDSGSTGYDTDFGVGWRKLSDTASQYTGTATATLTLFATAVESYAVVRCVAKDTDSTSNTYNKTFMDTASFIDNSDPLQVIITSTGGDVFKNGEGSTTLKAVVFQAGTEVDVAGSGTYTWTKYDKDSAIDTTWGTNGVKTGKTLSVANTDISTKATFMVEVVIS